MESLPTTEKEKDLDIAAINGGDFSSLAGTWRNGKGLKSSSKQTEKSRAKGSLKAVADSDKKSKIPYVEMKMGETGAAIGLLKIGFQNPDGDQSDTSKPRLVVTQSAGNYPADQYFTVNKEFETGLSQALFYCKEGFEGLQGNG